MSYLPELVHADGIRKQTMLSFGGYNHNLTIREGDCYDQTNLSSERAPVLSPRSPRYHVRKLTTPNGLFAQDGLFLVDGTTFYAGDTEKGTVTDSPKRFASLGAYIIILPDKVYYNRLTGEFGTLEAKCTDMAVTLKDGTYAGETAKGNTIYQKDYAWKEIGRASCRERV